MVCSSNNIHIYRYVLIKFSIQYISRFVTFTGNPKWPEIEEALTNKQMSQQPKKKYLSRADIVCRIFMDKAEEFVKDLCEKNVLGKVAGWCYSVEHQKRGLFCFYFSAIYFDFNKII